MSRSLVGHILMDTLAGTLRPLCRGKEPVGGSAWSRAGVSLVL